MTLSIRDFPRGGKQPKVYSTSNPLPGNRISKLSKKPRPKNLKKQNDANDNSDTTKSPKNDTFLPSTAECLTYSNLLEGMTILGRIHAVREYDIIVSLPGRLSGQISITNISEAYSNLLKNLVESQDKNTLPSLLNDYKSLPDLYKRGDYVVCHVQGISNDASEKYRVKLSLEPHKVNQQLDPRLLKKGAKLVCSVSSIEDHGWVVDTGLKTLRGFLSTNDVDKNARYFPGQQVFCSAKTIKFTENMATVKLSSKAKLKNSVLDCNSQSDESLTQPLYAFIPGTRVSLTVTKILSNGIRVNFNSDNVGFINQLYLKKTLASYELDSEVIGTLMYVLPTVKLSYFTHQSSAKEENTIPVGDTIEDAKVLFRDSKGVVFLLKKGIRGLLPFRRAAIDFDEIKSTFTPGSVHKCRVMTYDMFDRVYICSMEKEIMKTDCLLPEAAKPGDITTVEISRINPNGFLFVKSGNVIGNVAPEHVRDPDEEPKKRPSKKLKIGDKIRARVLGSNKQGNGLMFTFKNSLIDSKRPILKDIKEAKVGSRYQGTIVAVNKQRLLIRFFGSVKGCVPAKFLDKKIGGSLNYVCGQVILVKIENVDEQKEKLILSVVMSRKAKSKEANLVDTSKLNIGEEVEGTVVESSLEGVHLRFKIPESKDNVTGFVPAGHMAPCKELGTYLSSKYAPGDKFSASIFSVTPELLLTRTFVPPEKLTSFASLKMNDVIPVSVKEISTAGAKIIVPIKDFEDFGFVPFHKVESLEALSVNQVMFAKITGINRKDKKIFLSTALSEVWADAVKNDADMIAAVDVLTLYLSKLKELSNHENFRNKKICNMALGQRVAGKVEKITEHGLVLKLDNEVMATVRTSHVHGDYKVGDSVKGSVLWINYVHELVEVTLVPSLVNSISTKQNKIAEVSIDVQLRGEIVLVTNWFVLVLLKGQARGALAVLPSRRHVNDLEPDLSPYHVGKKVRCYVVLNQNETGFLPLCLVKSAFEARKIGVKRKIEKQEEEDGDEEDKDGEDVGMKVKRRKIGASELQGRENGVEQMAEGNKRQKIGTGVLANKKNGKSAVGDENGSRKVSAALTTVPIKRKIVDNRNENQNKDDEDEKKPVNINKLGIPECGFYWDPNPDPELLNSATSESDDDDDDGKEAEPKQKKKKLSAAERREIEKQKEQEIREREEALASNQVPNSVDQFDRLVLASPDSSIVWLQYMAYHLQATEIEKARAVAKRALRTINFREENEKLNVWQAWLNLESRFGSAESLNDVFHQAINANDAMKVYLHMLTVHLDAGRQPELEKAVRMLTSKFKDVPEVWVECGGAFLKMGLKDKSRITMQRALQSLPPPEHINLMAKFAQLEIKFGEKERAETLYESILTSYPKRVDVWCSYVDALVKSENYEAARKVLEKAVVQTLPPKKMKTLFKKFVDFEEKYGTPDGVERAKELAVTYVNNIKDKNQ